MRQFAFWTFLSVLFIITSCEDKPKQQEIVVQPEPQPVVDSVQLQVEAYELQLSESEEDVNKALRQLDRLSAQLQDSIEGTEVPPQIQEEMINSYQNRLHEVRQASLALKQWKERESKPADTLSRQARKEHLERELEQLERLMQETRQVRREAQSTMQEADRDEY